MPEALDHQHGRAPSRGRSRRSGCGSRRRRGRTASDAGHPAEPEPVERRAGPRAAELVEHRGEPLRRRGRRARARRAVHGDGAAGAPAVDSSMRALRVIGEIATAAGRTGEPTATAAPTRRWSMTPTACGSNTPAAPITTSSPARSAPATSSGRASRPPRRRASGADRRRVGPTDEAHRAPGGVGEGERHQPRRQPEAAGVDDEQRRRRAPRRRSRGRHSATPPMLVRQRRRARPTGDADERVVAAPVVDVPVAEPAAASW